MTCCTTLNRIRTKSPCDSGWKKLLRHLGKTEADDELLPFSVIVEANDLDDALWCCCSVDYDRVWRLYAVWCARQVQHLMTDKRSLDALDVAQAFASGMATRDALERAREAAGEAARAAAWDAAWAAAWAAARDAAWAAARDAAGGATGDAAWEAAVAAARDAAGAATGAAAWEAAVAAARDAAGAAQKAMFLRAVNASSEQAAVDLLLAEMPKMKETP